VWQFCEEVLAIFDFFFLHLDRICCYAFRLVFTSSTSAGSVYVIYLASEQMEEVILSKKGTFTHKSTHPPEYWNPRLLAMYVVILGFSSAFALFTFIVFHQRDPIGCSVYGTTWCLFIGYSLFCAGAAMLPAG
jgi:predicted MFS family arabinose efflux permease